MLLPFVLLAASATFEDSFRSGLLALQRNDLKTAQTELVAAAKLAPRNGRVWVALAQTYRKLNEFKLAHEAAAKAEALGAKDALVLSSLVLYFNEAGDTFRAAEAQARYAQLVPKDAVARERAEGLYFEAARPLLQQGKFPEAIPLLTAATSKLPDSAQLQLALGVACYGLRRFEEAAAAFLRTIALAPEIPQPYTFLGKFVDQIPGRLAEVTQHFIAFEKAHPEDYTGYYLHAKALNAQSLDAGAAVTLLRKAVNINDSDAGVHFELGAALDRLRQFPEAALEFEKANVLNPNDAATHYRLARVYDRLGKPEAAAAERSKHVALEAAARGAQK